MKFFVLVEHERKYTRCLERNKIIIDPFRKVQIARKIWQKYFWKTRALLTINLINWKTKKKKKGTKKEKRQYWKNKNSKAGFFFEKQFLLFARKGIIFHTILVDWSVTNNLDKSLILSHRFAHWTWHLCSCNSRKKKTIAPGRNVGDRFEKL